MSTAYEQRNVLLLLNLSRASGRNILSGIMHRMNVKTNWRLTIIQPQDHATEELLSILKATDFDGVISSEMEIPEVASFLEQSVKPLVVVGTRRSCIPARTKNLIFVSFDEDAIGRAGAKFLLSLGKFASYGFVHYTEKPYAYLSFLRKRGFRRALIAAKLDCTSFGEPGEDAATDRARMEQWLSGLAKPAAVFVGCDKRAIEVLDACNHLGLRVPGDISLLSVDNDEILCNSTSPSLSSIGTTLDLTGSRAVDALKDLFARSTNRPKRLCIDSSPHVVRRESCSVLAPGIDLAKRAMRFITASAASQLSVTDVVNHLGVSRRLADLRFREFHKKSILEAITDARLSVVKVKLSRSHESIDSIAQSCGFVNTNYLKILFKKHLGQTMSDYRQSHGKSGRRTASPLVREAEAPR